MYYAWVEVFPTFKRHVTDFVAPFAFSFVIFSSEYYRLVFCKEAFLSFVVIADFQSVLLFFFFFYMLLYGTSLGECMWIWQIYHIMSSSHSKPVMAFNAFFLIYCFYFIIIIIFLYNYCYENHFIKPNIHLFSMTKRVHLLTITIHLSSFSKVVHHIHGLKARKLQTCFSKDAGCRNQSTLTMSCECLTYPCWYFSALCKLHLLISQKLNPVKPYNCVYLLLL